MRYCHELPPLPADTPRLACPCCGYWTYVIARPDLICPVCGWERDGPQSGDPYWFGGPNPTTLDDCRKLFLRYGRIRPDSRTRVRYPVPEELPPAYEMKPAISPRAVDDMVERFYAGHWSRMPEVGSVVSLVDPQRRDRVRDAVRAILWYYDPIRLASEVYRSLALYDAQVDDDVVSASRLLLLDGATLRRTFLASFEEPVVGDLGVYQAIADDVVRVVEAYPGS